MKSTTNYIIAIDQSLRCTGIVVMDIDTRDVVHFEVIRTKTGLDTPETIDYVLQKIENFMERYKPQVMAIEDLAYGSFLGTSGRCLAGMFHCIVQMTRYWHRIPTHIINIGDVKRAATGHNNVSKGDMFFALPKELQTKFSVSHGKTTGIYDLADAYWVACRCLDVDHKKRPKIIRMQQS